MTSPPTPGGLGLGTKPRKLSREELTASIEKLIADYDAAFKAWQKARRTRPKEARHD